MLKEYQYSVWKVSTGLSNSILFGRLLRFVWKMWLWKGCGISKNHTQLI